MRTKCSYCEFHDFRSTEVKRAIKTTLLPRGKKFETTLLNIEKLGEHMIRLSYDRYVNTTLFGGLRRNRKNEMNS